MISATASSTRGVFYEIPDPHRAPEWLRSVTLGEANPDPGSRPAPILSREEEIRECDALAVSLSAAMRRLTVPLARAASAFRKKEGWCEFGYARVRDYTRQRTGFSAPWFGGLATVGDRIEVPPGFLDALTGEEGAPPLRSGPRPSPSRGSSRPSRLPPGWSWRGGSTRRSSARR